MNVTFMILMSIFSMLGKSETKELSELKEVIKVVPFLQTVEWLPVAVNVMDRDGNPVEEARVVIKLRKGKISFLTNGSGECNFYIDKEILDLQPICYAEKEDVDTLIISMNVSMHIILSPTGKVENAKASSPLFIETLNDKKRLKADGVTVYYSEGEKQISQKVLSILKKEKTIIKNILGVTPLPFSVLLSEKRNPVVNNAINIFPISLKRKDILESYYWFITHEWTEGIVEGEGGIISYERDPYTRWIGDGFAQYTAYKATESFIPDSLPLWISHRLHYFQEPYRQHRKYFDLLHWKAHAGPEPGEIMMKEIIGYPVCLYFWLTISERAGEGKIREFVKEAKQIKAPTNKELIPLLSKITGLNIKKELTHIDLDKVYNFYKKLSKKEGM